jgi:hypothetical protein
MEQFDPSLVPQASCGQQAGCLGDFNGDGALDMALVLTGRAEMAKQEEKEQGKPIAAGTTLYWNAARRLVTDVKEGNGPPLGKAEAAADANDQYASILVEGGNLVFFPRMVTKESGARGVIASLPLSAPSPGPVNVLAYSGKRLLGAWSVRAGEPGAVIGARFPGTITLKWTWPGGKAQEKKVKVTDGPARVLLDGN